MFPSNPRVDSHTVHDELASNRRPEQAAAPSGPVRATAQLLLPRTRTLLRARKLRSQLLETTCLTTVIQMQHQPKRKYIPNHLSHRRTEIPKARVHSGSVLSTTARVCRRKGKTYGWHGECRTR